MGTLLLGLPIPLHLHSQPAYQARQRPVHLDLFQPGDPYLDHRLIITNNTLRAGKVSRFFHGRGAQEGLFGELKSQMQMDYVPTRR